MTIPDLDMSVWRASIDRFDDEILKLIKARLALSEQVGKSKAHGGLAWRPAREAQLFARLVGRANTTLSAPAVERLWSTVIAQSLQAQGPAFLLVSRSDPALPVLAQSFFGLLPMQIVTSDAEALFRCASEEGAIAIVPAPDDNSCWWPELARLNRLDAPAPAVLAALPRFVCDAPPAAYALAMAPRERSGKDTAWFVADPTAKDIAQGTVLARQEGLSLVAFDGSFALQERPGLCQIGLFASPLAIT